MNRSVLPVVAALAALSFGAIMFPRSSYGSPQDSTKRPTDRHIAEVPTFDCSGTDFREAIQTLMRISGRSYTVAPEVQGTVTLHLRNVSFNTALQNLCRQVDATYRVEDGVTDVVPLLQPTRPVPEPEVGRMIAAPEASAGETVVVQDSAYLYIVRGYQTFKVRKTDMQTVAQGNLGASDGRVGGLAK